MPPRPCWPGGAATRTAGGTRPTPRRLDLRADRHPGAARRRPRLGQAAAGRDRVRARLLRRRRDVARARSTRARTSPPSWARRSSCSATTTAGPSPRRSSAQTRAAALADKAAGYGMPGVRVDGGDVLAVYEATREAVARARAGRGRRSSRPSLPRCAARDGRRPERLHRPERVEEEREHECLGRFEGYLRRRGLLDDALAARGARGGALALMRDGDRARPRRAAAPTRRSSSTRLRRPAAAARGRPRASCGGSAMA